jgi:hypothetical protein
MYLVYIFVLLVGVYLAPALAIWPRLCSRPSSACAIPVLSSAIIVTMATLFAATGLLQPVVVVTVSIAITLIAGVRLYRLRHSLKIDWTATERWIALLIIAVCLPLAVRLGFTSFSSNDEIYSWNMWAVQIYLGESPDFYYTTVPYPQGFSLLLAWGYALLGDLELQLPLRFTLGVFPIAMGLAVATVISKRTLEHGPRFALLLFAWMFMTASKSHLDNGLADPMMASALVVSIAWYIQHRREPDRFGLAPIVIAAILAAMTKQAALIWTCVALPILLMGHAPRRLNTWLAVVFLLGIPLIWMFSAGYGFWDNQGVIEASTKGRGAVDQMAFAVNRYLIGKPVIALMLIAAAWGSVRDRLLAGIFWLAAVPMMLAWFAFGAYDMRLGIHVVAIFALLITASNYSFVLFQWPARTWQVATTAIWSRPRAVLAFAFALSIIASALIIRPRIDGPFGASLHHGGQHTVAEHFGGMAPWVMNELYGRDDRVVWAPSNYVYGVFYGNTPVIRPDYGADDRYTRADFVAELIKHRPFVVIDSTEVLARGNAWDRLQESLALCPSAFEPVGAADGKHGFRIFVVRYPALESCMG